MTEWKGEPLSLQRQIHLKPIAGAMGSRQGNRHQNPMTGLLSCQGRILGLIFDQLHAYEDPTRFASDQRKPEGKPANELTFSRNEWVDYGG